MSHIDPQWTTNDCFLWSLCPFSRNKIAHFKAEQRALAEHSLTCMEYWSLPLIFRCETQIVRKKGVAVEQSEKMQVLYLLKIQPISPGKISSPSFIKITVAFYYFHQLRMFPKYNCFANKGQLNSAVPNVIFCLFWNMFSLYQAFSALHLLELRHTCSIRELPEHPCTISLLHYFTLAKAEDKTVLGLISVCKEDTEKIWSFLNFFLFDHNVEVLILWAQDLG